EKRLQQRLLQAARQNGVDAQHHEKRQEQSPNAPNHSSGNFEDGQKQSCHSEPALSQAERRLRPLQESLGMNAYLFAFAEHSQVFPQIEAIAQFGDGGLSFADLPQSGRGQQPARQGVFAHACARGGEKLEQATVAEKVEIGSVNVMQVLKTVSLLSYTRPAVPEACEAMTVDVGGALSMPPRSQDSGVPRRHQGKCREWNGH